MWLDQAGEDLQIGLHVAPIDGNGCASCGTPKRDMAGPIAAHMTFDAIAIHDVGADHFSQLRLACGPVETGRHQQEYATAWNALRLQRFKEGGKKQTLDKVQPEHRPLSLAVVIDVSSSLERYWPLLVKATPATLATSPTRCWSKGPLRRSKKTSDLSTSWSTTLGSRVTISSYE